MRVSSLLLPFLLVILAACQGQREGDPTNVSSDPLAAARALQAEAGEAADHHARLRVTVVPVEGRERTFDLDLYHDRSGRVRLGVRKYGHGWLDGLIERDGSFVAALLRDQQVLRSSLHQLGRSLDRRQLVGAAVFPRLRTFTNDLRWGPLPPERSLRQLPVDEADGAQVLVALDRDLQARLWFDRDDRLVRKQVTDGVGDPLYSLAYDHWGNVDGVKRPRLAVLEVPGDPTGYRLRLRSLDRLPGIEPRTLAVRLPADWPEIDVDGFIDLLVE